MYNTVALYEGSNRKQKYSNATKVNPLLYQNFGGYRVMCACMCVCAFVHVQLSVIQ